MYRDNVSSKVGWFAAGLVTELVYYGGIYNMLLSYTKYIRDYFYVFDKKYITPPKTTSEWRLKGDKGTAKPEKAKRAVYDTGPSYGKYL